MVMSFYTGINKKKVNTKLNYITLKFVGLLQEGIKN